jgi:ADP-ribose pyrophosphatase
MTRNVVYRGRKIEVVQDVTVLPDGHPVQYDVVLHPGAVVILPLIDAGHVCLLRNRRWAVGEELWEVPAGTLEPPEPPEEAAVRELAEETGYRAGRWRKLLEFYSSPGVLSERMHLFLAEDLTPGPQALEAGEQIRVEVVPWEQALAWARDGTIRDAKTLVALLYWRQFSDSTLRAGPPGAGAGPSACAS